MPSPRPSPTVSPLARNEAESQIRQLQKEIRYDTRDFPVEVIVSRFQQDEFFIPEYQREFIWTEEDQGRFIESVVMGLPIPMMFLAEVDDGRFEIVDGVQRIRTLEAFASNDLELKSLKTLELLNGFRFRDLPDSQQRKFLARALRVVVLDQDTSDENRRNLFDRINKSGRPLTQSERRRGAFAGPLLVFLSECAVDPAFVRLCPVSEGMRRRREPLELVTRFFCYSDQYQDFEHDVDDFLDAFVKDRVDSFDEKRYRQEFRRTLDFVGKHFPYGFAKSATSKTTPRVRFEALSVGVNLALRVSPDLVPRPVTPWLESDEFRQLTTTHASNSAPRLRGRIEFVRDRLLEGAAG